MKDIFVADTNEAIMKVLKGNNKTATEKEKGEGDYVLVVTDKRIVKVELDK